MDDNGEENTSNKEALKRTVPEVQGSDYGFPANPTGIVPLPRGSRGPRSLYIRRHNGSFGFTLRHFIVYPPESIAEGDRGGLLSSPMDTIFVRAVREGGAASRAGLRRGDRLVAVNGRPVAGLKYARVVHLIAAGPDYLHLLVVPKEEDILQTFFAETAYNPASNQPQAYVDPTPVDRRSAQQVIARRIGHQRAPEVRVDAASWCSLRNPYGGEWPAYTHVQGREHEEILRDPYRDPANHDIYAEIVSNEAAPIQLHPSNRAAPQVPLYRKMGRRASEGATPTEFSPANGSEEYVGMRPIYRPAYGDSAHEKPSRGGVYAPNSNRLSLHATRRESTSSLSSSLAGDGSKDSLLSSFSSASTVTGGGGAITHHDTDDDSLMMSRVRRSVRQKEEFLRTPLVGEDGRLGQVVQREFYGRPGRLEAKTAQWPPVSGEEISQANDTMARAAKPTHQNFLRVKNDIESERQNGRLSNIHNYSALADSPKSAESSFEHDLKEAAVAPDFGCIEVKGASNPEESSSDERRMYPPSLQIVQRRAREFESGSADEESSKRADMSKSELARLSEKHLVPKVSERAVEYDTAVMRAAAETSATAAATPGFRREEKRVHRDARSLDSSESNSSVYEQLLAATRRELSGNVTISTGSKYIHCPPPQQDTAKSADQLSDEKDLQDFRTRSNSTGSWVFVDKRKDDNVNVEDKPVVVKRRSKNTNLAEEERAMRRESYLKATEGGRMHIDSDFSDSGEIASQGVRSGSGSINSNSSSASLEKEKITSSSPCEKFYSVIKEGAVHCKILEIDGKRANDRSWKQVWLVLKGPKLFIYKDRHHQSPIGSSGAGTMPPASSAAPLSADPLDARLAAGLDARACAVRAAAEYAKRKRVLRVSAARPARAELLLRAHRDTDFADWARALQAQAATATEQELDLSGRSQKAVPQATPATTSVQVQGSTAHLAVSSPTSGAKTDKPRPRSPTGQSPVSKARKQPSAPPTLSEPSTSPKSKTWRGRVAKQFRKFNHGANSPSSPTAPEGSTFGIPLEECIPSSNCYVPRFVEVCTDIIDERGLNTVGIYRVPGNNASITALTEEVNKNFDDVPLEDPRWNDLHVVSSLLKSYFRKMPDSLVTAAHYPHFIRADKIEDPKLRMEELKRLVKSLPKHNYHTLKHVVLHLKKVADNSEVNRMEAKNLAIVFGPTIVRPEGETMESMVTNMTNQCKIVESLITNAEWFFPENEECSIPLAPLALPDTNDEFESNNQALLENISKYEALAKDQKEKNGALFSSIISAAQRKVKRKPTKVISSLPDSSIKEDLQMPSSPKTYLQQQFSPNDLKENENSATRINVISSTEMEKKNKEKVPWFNYSTDKDEFHRRIENFKQETEAMLQLPRKTEICVTNIESRTSPNLSTSTHNVNQHHHQQRTSTTTLCVTEPAGHGLSKTHSATNVFSAAASRFSTSGNTCTSAEDVLDKGSAHVNGGRGGMKKIKYESETDGQRIGSLESLTKLPNDDGESLLSTMTKLIDQKLKEEHSPNELVADDIPYADESPERHPKEFDKENIPRTSDLYKNPSLHKAQYHSKPFKESTVEKEKEEDTMASVDIPDNEKHISPSSKLSLANLKVSPKLKRSESLNKPERTASPLNNKLRRSESLNKTGDKLKRSDSLTKTEKTESNINKRREIVTSCRRMKDSTKNKRKNGMPDRSIKRRHTVGGTKDPDKVRELDKNQDNNNAENEINQEKSLRTSSPDLSSTRRDKFFLEIKIGSVLALRQHFISGRPQSYPESTTVFKVPLESHV